MKIKMEKVVVKRKAVRYKTKVITAKLTQEDYEAFHTLKKNRKFKSLSAMFLYWKVVIDIMLVFQKKGWKICAVRDQEITEIEMEL